MANQKAPRLKRDWVGRRVKLLRDVESRGGNIFPAGMVLLVTRNFGGLHLEYVEACEHCSMKYRNRVVGIPERDVELLPEDA